MRTLFLITAAFLTEIIYSQDINKIRDADTLYVLFQYKENRQLYNKEKWSVKDQNYDSYYFVFTEEPYQYLTFLHHPLVNSEEKTESKSFLKRKKDITVDYKFLIQFNIAEAAQLFNDKKKIYIIDRKMNHKGKILLRSVQVLGVVPQHEE